MMRPLPWHLRKAVFPFQSTMPIQQTLKPVRDSLIITDDAQEAYRRLEQDADRLFASKEVKVLVWPKNELTSHFIETFAEC